MQHIGTYAGPLNHVNWRNGVRIGPLDEDRITAFIPPFEREDRVYHKREARSPSTP